jgi:hypothetical protein
MIKLVRASVVCLLLLLPLAACGGRKESAGDAGTAAAPAPGAGAPSADASAQAAPSADATAEAPAPAEISLLFPGLNDDLLHLERRAITPLASPADQAKLVLSELFKGPSPGLLRAIPDGAQVRELYLLADGTAWADITADILKVRGGATDELLAVYSIVDTLALNIPEIRRVGILVNGQTRRTLAGHLDLERPFDPEYRYLEEALRPASLAPPGAPAEGEEAGGAAGASPAPGGEGASGAGQGSAPRDETEGMAPPPAEVEKPAGGESPGGKPPAGGKVPAGAQRPSGGDAPAGGTPPAGKKRG